MSSSVTNDLADVLRDQGEHGKDFARCESPSLRLEKFVHLGDNSKKNEIDAVVACHREHARPIPVFEPKGAVSFVAKLRSRLIVNQAGGILENAGLCLHPHFGAPYIPGSAVKGIARHAAWSEWNEEADETKKAATANRIAEVFGYPTGDSRPKKEEEATRGGPDSYLDDYLAARGWKDKSTSGTVAFLSAVPVDAGRLATDIVNCHHPKYYAGDNPYATDDESPNPQFFPAVDEGVSFLFSIVPVHPGGDVDAARAWLVRALSENGAGAKTAAGYGWFDCNPSLTEEWRNKIEHERLRRELEELKSAFVTRLDELKAMSDEELATHAAEVNALPGRLDELSEKLDSVSMGGRDFRSRHQPAVNVLIARLRPSPLDALRSSWENQRNNLNGLIGNNVAAFNQLPDDKKVLVCRLLREQAGIGAEIRAVLNDENRWPHLNNAQRKRWRQGLQTLRAYCKNTMNPGKMP